MAMNGGLRRKIIMKIWVDDLRPAPIGWHWCKSVKETIDTIKFYGQNEIEELSLDHDSGIYYYQGGDYINILNWIEKKYGYFWKVPINLHTMNPVGRNNMDLIIWEKKK